MSPVEGGMETFYAAIVAATIGSILIIINEWTKLCFEKRKQKKKFTIWSGLEQTEQEQKPPSLTVEQISKDANLYAEEVESLLYEMVQEGTIQEGPFPGTFTRYKIETQGIN